MHPLSVICGVHVLNTSNFLLIQRKRAITIPAKLNKTSWKIYCVSQTMLWNKKFKFWEETAGGNHEQEYANGLLSDFPLIITLKHKIENWQYKCGNNCKMLDDLSKLSTYITVNWQNQKFEIGKGNRKEVNFIFKTTREISVSTRNFRGGNVIYPQNLQQY